MILFDRVSFRYKEKQEASFAIEEVSFSLCQKKIHGFIGGNGSGKTTVARLIAGLLKPVSGKVEVCGIDTSAEDALIHRKVGIIFQNPDNQIVGTTVEEDIAFGLENLGVETDMMPGKMDRVVSELGIGDLMKMPVHHLSGGQKQMLCIASVLVMEPEWIIFDEPTSHLDPWARREFYRTVRKIVETRNTGVIMISQISDDFELFDEIRIFSEGKVAFNGSSAELKKQKDLRHLYKIPEKWLFDEFRQVVE